MQFLAQLGNEMHAHAFFKVCLVFIFSTAGALVVVTVSIHPSSPLRHFAYSGASSSFYGIIVLEAL